MQVIISKALRDNYSYLLLDTLSRECLAVDPVHPQSLLAKVPPNVRLVGILTTHHHSDHSGGNAELLSLQPHLRVYGAQDTRIPGLTHPLSHGSTISLGQSISIKALSTPCHTTGSLCFFATEDQHGKKDQKHALFSGDTLFVAGCGRFFEGSAKEMYMNLVETLGSLPPQTAIYPGHEYTAKNLEFALSLEPENEDIRNKLEWARKVDCTVPSQIQDEWLTNPFMRVNEFARREGLPEARESGIQVMQRIRALKDAF